MNVNFHQFIANLTAIIEAKDHYTSGHSNRVAELTYLIAQQMGYDKTFCEKLHIGAHLHDIGKIGIPDGILLKSSKLTIEEYAVIKTHSIIGYNMLKNNPELDDIPVIIKHHHERIDGNGYPGKLSGNDIPIGSRIIALADSFDAMVTSRPYKPVMTINQAKTEICACANTQFDKNIVDVFLEMLSKDTCLRNVLKLFEISK